MEEEQSEVERLRDEVVLLRRLCDWYRKEWLAELWNDTGSYKMRIGTKDPEPRLGTPS